jgi:hypothetical protein
MVPVLVLGMGWFSKASRHPALLQACMVGEDLIHSSFQLSAIMHASFSSNCHRSSRLDRPIDRATGTRRRHICPSYEPNIGTKGKGPLLRKMISFQNLHCWWLVGSHKYDPVGFGMHTGRHAEAILIHLEHFWSPWACPPNQGEIHFCQMIIVVPRYVWMANPHSTKNVWW